MSDLFPVSIDDMLGEIGREIRLRQGVYPRLVLRHEMRQAEADRHLDIMRTVQVFLSRLKLGPSAETLRNAFASAGESEPLSDESVALVQAAWTRIMRVAVNSAQIQYVKPPQNGDK